MMTPATPSPAHPMRAWLARGLVTALFLGTCWGGAAWYWRATDRTPGTGELVLFLLALPLALLVASWVGRKRFAPRAAAPAAAGSGQPPQAPTAVPPLAILAASLRSPHGASAEELSAAIADNTARADLDQELVDANGFPVMTARSDDALDEVLQEEITEWLARNGMAELRLSDEQWRALTMASAVACDLASYAAADLIRPEAAPPTLQLMPILPPEWHIDQRRGASMWLRHAVTQLGWPPTHISMADEEHQDASAATPSAVLGRLERQGTLSDAPLAALVVACASHIGEESVAQWAASGSLFTGAQQGLVPGEGAAGLLVTDLRQARSIDGAAFTLLDPMGETRHNSSADHIRRADPGPLAELAERMLKGVAVELSDVAMIVADTDHRSSRVLELMGLASAATPHLDGVDDVVRVGVASGTCGAVPFMTALALARHYALERDAPVLCISNHDQYYRCAALLRPATSLA